MRLLAERDVAGSDDATAPADEEHRDRERGYQQAEDAELEQHIREGSTLRRAALELGRDDEDPPDDRDEADVEERLDGDLVRPHDEAQRVKEFADDQRKQNTVEHENSDVNRAAAVMQLADETRHGADEHEDSGDRQQKPDGGIEDDLEAAEPAAELLGQPRPVDAGASGEIRLRHSRTIRGQCERSAELTVSDLESLRMDRLLVANRGEIAVRIFRACRSLGIETVAVVAPDDLGSLHARAADTTFEIASYLDAGEYVRAARESGADAVHPGYGFLSESAELAEAVLEAGLTWIGPPPAALRAGGDKLAAKRTAVEAGVPVLPNGTPDEVGYPLLVKAAAGGGGRGMRIVRIAAELADAVDAAKREAAAAFGDDTVFFERYLERPRHVEIQLLADKHGTVLALGERDCSIQRRHQKVLEESPSPALDPDLRARMGDAAVAFAQAIGYESAGTAEFVLDGRDFYFLELNARIQVEHPVTELVTGVDIVREQLRIADGERLDARVELRGHAIEVRLYAEDPRTFLPQAGRIERLHLPQGIRVDAGVEQGDEIGTSYDPMIAKLIAHGSTRSEALHQLTAALRETVVDGVTTNLPILRWLVAHPLVRAGRTTTAFLTENPPLSEAPPRAPARAWSGSWRLNLPGPPPSAAPDIDASAREPGSTPEQAALTAPMPGTVIRVLVEPGAHVTARQQLVVLEAMKMETPLVAPYDATIKAVHVAEGDRVAGGALLVELEE